jgi:RNA polymerase sigma factor (sigma-70 family)
VPESARVGFETTTELLTRVRAGDAAAREQLFGRYLPRLRQWAHGRLPTYARAISDTDDLIQTTLVRTLNRVDDFRPQHEGALMAYLRKALLNAVREEIRRTGRRAETPIDEAASRVESAVGREAIERYESALAQLGEREREAVILRLEFGYTHEEIAQAIGSPTANAARMTVSRAFVRLAEGMSRGI